jgi:1-acyl-sn-glycerol-3-phosphate acyltransferase
MPKYLRLGLTGGLRLFVSTPWILRYGHHPEKYPLEKRFSRFKSLIAYVCRIMPCRFIIKGEENIPTGTNVVYAPNHMSNMDPLVLIAMSSGNMTFIAKKEALKFPYVGTIIKGLSGIFIDRQDLRQEVSSISAVSMQLRAEPSLSYVIFPEGTRSRDPFHQVASFKAGALKPAYNAQKPIVPVAIYGTFRCLDKKCKMKRYPIQISYLKPHMPEEFAEHPTVEMAKIIEDEVRAEVDRLREEDKKYIEEDKNPRLKNVEFNIKGLF